MNTKVLQYGLIASLFIALILPGCKKDPIEKDVHENLVVNNNNAPPYDGVTQLQVQHYVNKLHIDLIGEKPDSAALSHWTQHLFDNNLHVDARSDIVNDLMGNYKYYKRLTEATAIRIMNGSDSAYLAEQIYVYQLQQVIDSAAGNKLEVQIIQIEIDKLEDLLNVTPDYRSGAISVNEFYRRFLYNAIYDEINMGSENFVKSVFENLFFRPATAQELLYGVDMVDGVPSQLFLQDGNNKWDFLVIATTSHEFYQGLVIEFYQNYFARNPSSGEMAGYAQELQASLDLQDFQRKLLISREYAGF